MIAVPTGYCMVSYAGTRLQAFSSRRLSCVMRRRQIPNVQLRHFSLTLAVLYILYFSGNIRWRIKIGTRLPFILSRLINRLVQGGVETTEILVLIEASKSGEDALMCALQSLVNRPA